MSKAATTTPKTRIFGGYPQEVRSVRDFVTQAVQGCPIADDAALLASELATNAVRHTRSGRDGTFSVCVYVEAGWLRVEVNDLGSDTAPSIRRAGTSGESGAGLRIVDTIADRWGFHGGPHGRVVWFELDWQ
jgi:anti-sigma regulatory factor (Ser/Thr protein kinase)